PAASFASGSPPSFDRADFLPHFSVPEEGQADPAPMANSGRDWMLVTVHWQWHGFLGGEDSSFGHCGAIGSHGFAVDGADRLAAPRRKPTGRARARRIAVGLCRTGAPSRPEGSWWLGSHQP